jgi:hypothetical protein
LKVLSISAPDPQSIGMPEREKGAFSAYSAFSAHLFGKPAHDKGTYRAYSAFSALKFGKSSPRAVSLGNERGHRAHSPEKGKMIN